MYVIIELASVKLEQIFCSKVCGGLSLHSVPFNENDSLKLSACNLLQLNIITQLKQHHLVAK